MGKTFANGKRFKTSNILLSPPLFVFKTFTWRIDSSWWVAPHGATQQVGRSRDAATSRKRCRSQSEYVCNTFLQQDPSNLFETQEKEIILDKQCAHWFVYVFFRTSSKQKRKSERELACSFDIRTFSKQKRERGQLKRQCGSDAYWFSCALCRTSSKQKG